FSYNIMIVRNSGIEDGLRTKRGDLKDLVPEDIALGQSFQGRVAQDLSELRQPCSTWRAFSHGPKVNWRPHRQRQLPVGQRIQFHRSLDATPDLSGHGVEVGFGLDAGKLCRDLLGG